MSERRVFCGFIEYVPLEGGFFGLITDDGQRYVPTNLPTEFRLGKLRVCGELQVNPDQIGFQQWGVFATLLSIRRHDENSFIVYPPVIIPRPSFPRSIFRGGIVYDPDFRPLTPDIIDISGERPIYINGQLSSLRPYIDSYYVYPTTRY